MCSDKQEIVLGIFQQMGMRDHIAHGYFDIDAELVFQTVKNNLKPLLDAVRFFINELTHNNQ